MASMKEWNQKIAVRLWRWMETQAMVAARLAYAR
jgi:hypothetical protein